MTRKEMITMKFKRLVTALLSATLMISLAACSGNEKPAESQTGEGTTAEAIHVNLAESWGFEYFYTIITPDVSSSTGYDITYYLTSFYDTLVTYNENNELVGSLAEDWSMSDDGKVYTFHIKEGIKFSDDDDKIRLNQRKPSKYKGLSRFGPEKNLQRINKFMKERPIFYKNLIQMKENFRFYLRCFYCITKVVILQFNSENRTELARNG